MQKAACAIRYVIVAAGALAWAVVTYTVLFFNN